jgi:hypothetical protein
MQPTRNLDEKITYYLGAGASANAIPMVGQIIDRLNDFERFLTLCQNNIGNKVFIFHESSMFNSFQSFCEKWVKLVKESPSIDTLAKRLFDQEKHQEYGEYKAFLSILFNYFHYTSISYKPLQPSRETIYSHSLEGRYENLIRSINHYDNSNENSISIPKNFNLISWNYDFQFEITAYNDIKNEPVLKGALNKKVDNLGLSILNLNGTSLVSDKIISEESFGAKSLIEFIIDIYIAFFYNEEENQLKFAWEKSENISTLNNFAEESKYVVIIGYSFPSFNRDVDNAYFHSLKPSTKVFTQGSDYADSVRIEKYLRQTFIDEKPKFKITPVESPFFYVPAEYFLKKKAYSNDVV